MNITIFKEINAVNAAVQYVVNFEGRKLYFDMIDFLIFKNFHYDHNKKSYRVQLSKTYSKYIARIFHKNKLCAEASFQDVNCFNANYEPNYANESKGRIKN